MKQFVHDMIHMTEGERLLNYWYVWIALIVSVVVVLAVVKKLRG